MIASSVVFTVLDPDLLGPAILWAIWGAFNAIYIPWLARRRLRRSAPPHLDIAD